MEEIGIIHFTNYAKGQSRASMSAVMQYTMQDKKTQWQGQQLVTGVNCRLESAYADFLNTKLLYHKEGGTMFYHLVHSFPKGTAVDPVTAHAAAVKLADYFGGREVLVSTHTDRDHIHSHLIINSVSLDDGRKLHISGTELEELRQLNDRLCMEFSLPVFQPQKKQQTKSLSGAEYHAAAKGESWKFRLMNTIDDCMCYAKTKAEFMTLMKSEGYDIRWTGSRKNITYTTPDGNKCRDSKLHDNKYLKEAMELEFAIRAELISGGIETAQPYNEHSAVRRLGRTDEYALGHQQPVGGAEQAAESAASQSVEFTDAGSGNFSGPDLLASGTGWEKEREACLAMALAPAGHSSELGLAAAPSDSHSLVGDLLQLGHDLERAGNGSTVSDSTTMPVHHESKQRRQEREKKIALGHRPDDHEETFTYSMPTM